MEGLVVQLDNYSRLGIPKLQHLTVFPDPAEDLVEEALYSLEDNWTDIVERHAGLSERLKAQQTALWELISTELAYIRTLKVIQDVSLLDESSAQSKFKLFSNKLLQITKCTNLFWEIISFIFFCKG